MGNINRKRQGVLSFYLKINVDFRNILKDLKGANLAVFMTIALHMDIEMKSFPGINRISLLTGYDRKTVINSVRSLIEMDLIKRHKRYHKSSVYTVKAYIFPLHESGKVTLSDNNESRKLPLSQSQDEIYSRELTPTEDNNNQYKKKLRREKKSPSRNKSHEKELSVRQLKDLEKKRASVEDQRIKALPEADRQILEKKAYALLPPILRERKFYIRIKMRELLDKYSLDGNGVI